MSLKKSRMPIGIGIAFVNYGDLSGILLDQNCISILWVLVSWYQFVMPSEAMQFWVSLIALKKLPQANWGWISMCKGTSVLCRGSVELCKGTAELTNVSCGDWTEVVVVVVAGSSCVGQMLQRLLQSTCCSTQWIHTKPFWWQRWQWWCNTETTYMVVLCSVFSVSPGPGFHRNKRCKKLRCPRRGPLGASTSSLRPFAIWRGL